MKKLYVGAAYYPEMWDSSEIDKDITRCKSLGINYIISGRKLSGRYDVSPYEVLVLTK